MGTLLSDSFLYINWPPGPPDATGKKVESVLETLPTRDVQLNRTIDSSAMVRPYYREGFDPD
jgi:hypothetical protein